MRHPETLTDPGWCYLTSPTVASADCLGAGWLWRGSYREVRFFLIEAPSFAVTPVLTDSPVFRASTGARVGALFSRGAAGELRLALSPLTDGDGLVRRQAVLNHFERELSWPVVGARALAAYRAAAEARRAPVRA